MQDEIEPPITEPEREHIGLSKSRIVSNESLTLTRNHARERNTFGSCYINSDFRDR